MLPSWIRSSRCRPRLTYFLATETTRRRLASTRSFLALSASISPWRMTGQRVPQVGQAGAGHHFALARLPASIHEHGLMRRDRCGLDALQFALRSAPTRRLPAPVLCANCFQRLRKERNRANGAGCFDTRTAVLHDRFACGASCWSAATAFALSIKLQLLLIQATTHRQTAAVTSSRRFLSAGLPSSISALPRSTKSSSSWRSRLMLLGHLDNDLLDQRRPADRLLHPELAALHFAGEGDFAFAGQKRNGTHFAQIHANRIVGVNRFFYSAG